MMRLPRLASLALVSLTLGCGATPKVVVQPSTPVAPPPGADFAALVKEGDEHWAKRDARAELEAAISSWEKAVAIKADDAETLVKLTRGVYLLADGHLAFGSAGSGKYTTFEGDEAGKLKYLELHEKGITLGQRAIAALSPAIKQRLDAGAPVEEVVDQVDKGGIPALYWYTSNLGKWANAQGFTTVLKYKNKIKRNIERCLALDEHFFYSAPHRYLGVIFAKAPAIAGGDMGEAKKHFDASLANSPSYLATRVLWAEFYAVKAEDKEGFRRELEHVLKQADDVLPEILAENRIEKRKAQSLLSQIDEKF